MARQLGNKWQASVILNGKRYRPHFKSRAEAEAYEASMSDERKTNTNLIGSLFVEYAEALWKHDKSWVSARYITRQLIEMIGANTPVHRINTGTIDAVIKKCHDLGNATQTINNKLTRLSKLLKRAQSRKIITNMPLIELFKQQRGRVRYFTQDEERSLMSELKEGDRMFCTFLLYSACRVGEAKALTWADVEGDMCTFWRTKGNKARSVPINEPMSTALEWSRAQGHSAPFSYLSYTSFIKRWRKIRIKAGFTGDHQVVPHALRHTAATRLATAEVGVLHIRDYLGHSDSKTSEIYIHMAKGHLADASRKLAMSNVSVPFSSRAVPKI